MYGKLFLAGVVAYALHVLLLVHIGNIFYYGLTMIFGAAALVSFSVWVQIGVALAVYVLPLSILFALVAWLMQVYVQKHRWWQLSLILVGVYILAAVVWLFIDTGFSPFDVYTIIASWVVSGLVQAGTVGTAHHFFIFWALYFLPFLEGPYIGYLFTQGKMKGSEELLALVDEAIYDIRNPI